MPSPKILCVSFDRVVSESRSRSVREAGYDVTAGTSINDALDILEQVKFDAVIVGHRFPLAEKYMLAAEAQEKFNTPVVLICGASHDPEIPATSRVYALEGSEGIITALSKLVPVKPAPRAPAAA